MNEIVKILMNRDGMTEIEAENFLSDCRGMIKDGYDPDDVLQYELGLEPDYIFDLLY